VTAWEALTGERPFRGESLGELEAALARGVPAGDEPDIPPRLRAVLERGLSRAPEERYPDMDALLQAISEALEPPAKARTPWKIYAAAAAAVVAVSATITTVKLMQPGAASTRNAVTAAAARECAAPDREFDRVWSSDRRTRALQDDDKEMLGAIVLLDSTRRDWVSDFNAACTARATTARDCLLRVRDDLASITKDEELPIERIAIAAAGMDQCTRRGPPRIAPPQPPRAPMPPVKFKIIPPEPDVDVDIDDEKPEAAESAKDNETPAPPAKHEQSEAHR